MPISSASPLAIVGNLNVDQWVRTVTRFPQWDEEVLVDSVRLELAGTAGYALQTALALGIPPFVVSTLGDDPFGQFTLDTLADLGVDASGVEVLPGEETSLGMVFVGREGQRGILTTLGAHRRMGVEVADRQDRRVSESPEVFLCGAYLLPNFSPADLIPYARRLRKRGQVVAFDPSWDPGGWGERTRGDTFALLAEVDVYLPNEEELISLTGASSWQAALEVVAGLPGEVVLKRGKAGAVYVGPEGRIAMPGFPVVAVNTIGAGDAFDIGYLFGRRLGWPPDRTLRFACAVAALIISQPGPRSYPQVATIEAFLETHQAA